MLTYIIIGLTVAISFYAWERPSLFHKLMMNPYRAHRQNEAYRFVSSGFIHNDHMHLLFNMFSFYFFGSAVEQIFQAIFGSWKGGLMFVALYVLAIIVSDIPSYWKHKDHPHYNSLGASGGVSAIVFAFILFQPLQLICLFFAICLPGFIMGLLFIIFSYYQGKRGKDNINHSAHLYGAVFGFLFCAIMYPDSLPAFWQQLREWNFLEKYF